jgi:hypothetical protein
MTGRTRKEIWLFLDLDFVTGMAADFCALLFLMQTAYRRSFKELGFPCGEAVEQSETDGGCEAESIFQYTEKESSP